ncbi:NADH:flavin oxidoreductase [bacterium]|nr:NADH:flavin oxidoreductase [bacterium]
MSELFKPLIINRLKINNRFIRSATMDNLGRNAGITEDQLSLYRDLACGEIGMIISGGIFPAKNGQINSGQLGAHCDEMISSLKKMVEVVHANGGKIAGQLMHAGWFCRPSVTGCRPIGPSSMVNPVSGLQVRELSSEEIYKLVDDFVQAGNRIVEAGFDAIQLHAAHNWLISAFLSPVTNRRVDEWGGCAEKRMNFVREIYKGIRRVAGNEYPILIKLGLKDYHPGGKLVSEGISTAKFLEEIGFDAIEISEGLEACHGNHIRPGTMNPYYLEECREARPKLNLPLILVGGMRNLDEMEMIVKFKMADAVSMCRPFIMDRYIIRKFRMKYEKSSNCISCNKCLKELACGRLRCVHIAHNVNQLCVS